LIVQNLNAQLSVRDVDVDEQLTARYLERVNFN